MRTSAWRGGWPLTCREVVELVTDYLDGTLPAGAAAGVRAHLEECAGCEAYVEQLRQTVRALAAAPLPVLPEQTRLDLLAAFRRRDDRA
jgi:anti-sigma factor RsiW